jgi:hypothetical protein
VCLGGAEGDELSVTPFVEAYVDVPAELDHALHRPVGKGSDLPAMGPELDGSWRSEADNRTGRLLEGPFAVGWVG